MATAGHVPKSPRELYRIAKRQGIWDPERIPVADDRVYWERLSPGQREQLLKICALFYEGEVSVADTLAWFMVAMPDADRRMFLSTQIIEEVKHAEFFEIYFREVLGKTDTSAYLVPEFRGVLLDELQERGRTLGKAAISGSAEEMEHALVLGVAHYMGVVEGLLAVSGYDYFDAMLAERGIFPRLLEGIRLIRADEGRHLTHGMDFLRELISQKPRYAPEVRQLFMSEGMKIPARTEFIFKPNDFGLDQGKMMTLAYAHVQQRMTECRV